MEAIDWLLLTNVAVDALGDAWQRVAWYACRMVVEDYHKGMKTGVSIEELQLTTRGRLEAAIAVLSVVAVVLLAVRDGGAPRVGVDTACVGGGAVLVAAQAGEAGLERGGVPDGAGTAGRAPEPAQRRRSGMADVV